MSRRSSTSLRAPRRPHFYWQGTLIVLPALVLAAAGFSALRQDRAYAEHEAREQARHLAADLAQVLIPRLLHEGAEPLPGLEQALPVPLQPQDDPVMRASRRTPARIIYAVSDRDGFAYPPPPRRLPWPQSLDIGLLDAGQKEAWERLEESWRSGPGEGGDLHPKTEAFLGLSPPEAFAAVARHRSAQMLKARGQTALAATWLRLCSVTEAVDETGIPLRDLAAMELVPLVPDAERHKIAADLAARLVAEPTPLSPLLLAALARGDPTANAWVELFADHQKARDFFGNCADSTRPEEAVECDGQKYWPYVETVAGGRWIIGLPLEAEATGIESVLAAEKLPAHFGVALTLGERVLRRAGAEAEVLATATRLVPLAGGTVPLSARITLADPAGFYSRQHTRTLRFGALIALAAGAVLIGFFSAWRAFRRQQQLSEMKTNFVSSVSHELRAPIASVRLMAEELEAAPGASPEKARQYHRFINQECRRLSAVIENVLDFSRSEQGKEQFDPEEMDIEQLVAETAGVMRVYAAEREVTLETALAGDAQSVEADPRALGRLLVNLLDNAIKHSPPGATVRVGVEFTGSHFRLWVEDHGPGIPADEHTRIFERFYRVGSELQRETPGVGLGLAIVRQVASAHGGRVLVRSAPGEGSCFTVEFPRRQASMAHGARNNGNGHLPS